MQVMAESTDLTELEQVAKLKRGGRRHGLDRPLWSVDHNGGMTKRVGCTCMLIMLMQHHAQLFISSYAKKLLPVVSFVV
eukprot:SAG11_NODE_12109_length_721_cov_1.339228_2_plen_79_part_00